MDLRSRLEYPSAGKTTVNAMILILKHKEHYVGFLVDSVGEVLEVDTETFHAAPETLRGAAKEMILGSYKLDKVLLKILNVENMKDFKIAI
jgi:purine-binding chemotaxis protein CheW